MVTPTPETNHSTQSIDVLIIGGGPAGSTAGAWLGKNGTQAMICEKEHFPRFHIGESLLPNGNHILQETGVWEIIQDAGFVKKYGAEFTLPDRSHSVQNNFSDGLVKGLDTTYQVERSRFDKILLDHAAECGCEVRQRTVVIKTTHTGKGWTVVTRNLENDEEKTILARWIIDASGRNCVMGRSLRIEKERIPYPGRYAVFNHFKGSDRHPGKTGGDIIILRLQDAWFWAIPISESVTSVGVVAQKGARSEGKESNKEFFWKKVHQSSFLTNALAQATSVEEYRTESDYCFSYHTFGQNQVLLAGDAASFIDPVFSSGVYLALESGLLAAKTIYQNLESGAGSGNAKVYNNYTRSMKKRINTIRVLIESFYDNSNFEVFMSPQPGSRSRLKIPEAINSIVAGCSKPPFFVRWRFWIFRKICALHKKHPFLRPINWRSVSQKP